MRSCAACKIFACSCSVYSLFSTTTTAPTRYTLNHDGTLEKWYLEHDCGEIVYLRKTSRPKWNCCMKEFPAAEVFPDYKTARAALKARASAKIAP